MRATVGETLLEGLADARVALVEGDRTIRADRLRMRALGMAAWMAARGVTAGDRVCVFLRPGLELTAGLLGLMWIGAVPVVLDPQNGPAVVATQAARSEAAFVLASRTLARLWSLRLAPLLRWLGRDLPPPIPGPTLLVAPEAVSGDVPPGERGATDEAAILFTSGTTGRPRAAVHTQASLAALLEQVALVASDLAFGSLVADTPGQVFYSLRLGVPCHTVAGPAATRARRVLSAVRSGAEAYFGSPWIWSTWLRNGVRVPAHVRAVILGAAPVTAPFLRRLLPTLSGDTRVRCVYGLTECGPVCAVDGRHKAEWRGEGDLVGPPVGDVSLRLAQDGEVEVWSRSSARSLSETAPTWLPTGDLGRLGPEGLALLGRRKDMIIRRGLNIYPALLEPLLQDRGCDGVLVGVYDSERADERVVLAHTGDGPGDLRDLLRGAAPDHLLRLRRLPRRGRQAKIDRAAVAAVARSRFRIPG